VESTELRTLASFRPSNTENAASLSLSPLLSAPHPHSIPAAGFPSLVHPLNPQKTRSLGRKHTYESCIVHVMRNLIFRSAPPVVQPSLPPSLLPLRSRSPSPPLQSLSLFCPFPSWLSWQAAHGTVQ
jgi:hypothetical protein